MNTRIQQLISWCRYIPNRGRTLGSAAAFALLAVTLPGGQIGCLGSNCTLIGCEGYYQLDITDVDQESLDGLHVEVDIADGEYVQNFDCRWSHDRQRCDSS